MILSNIKVVVKREKSSYKILKEGKSYHFKGIYIIKKNIIYCPPFMNTVYLGAHPKTATRIQLRITGVMKKLFQVIRFLIKIVT